LTLVIASLGAGGAERVLSALANRWHRDGDHVTVVTFAAPGDDFFSLAPGVERVSLDRLAPSRNAVGASFANLARVVALRRAIERTSPDAVVSFIDQTNVLTLAATAGLRVAVVISERIDPARHPLGRVWHFLRRVTYRRATFVVVQHERFSGFFASFVPRRKLRVIPNPIAAEAMVTSANRALTVVAVGRLTHQKGFDLLLRAFAKASRAHEYWSLILCGEGADRDDLAALAGDLGVAERVIFRGRCANWWNMVPAEIFALSSRYEGFPNALAEAMSSGLAVVAFDCSPVIREVIRHRIDGIVVPGEDVLALAGALEELMGGARLRRELAARAPEVRERYSLDRIAPIWRQMFVEARRQDP
jgi:glycosyltransferase involved in cell wall biosynthesis